MSNIINILNEGPIFIVRNPDTGDSVTIDGDVICTGNYISIEPVEELFLLQFPNKTKCVYSNEALEALWALLDSNCREDNWVE